MTFLNPSVNPRFAEADDPPQLDFTRDLSLVAKAVNVSLRALENRGQLGDRVGS
jgi:hypothetical protein